MDDPRRTLDVGVCAISTISGVCKHWAYHPFARAVSFRRAEYNSVNVQRGDFLRLSFEPSNLMRPSIEVAHCCHFWSVLREIEIR
jgi:hypothetical protein